MSTGPHHPHLLLRFHTIHTMRLRVLSKPSRSLLRITLLWKWRRIAAVAAASVLSCNLHFPPLYLLVYCFSSNDSPGDKAFQGLSLSLICSDPVLHVVLSPSTFRHALPSEDVYYILVRSFLKSSITEAVHPTLTTASFGCKYSQSALYPWFLQFSAQLAATYPHIRRSFLVPRSFLACQPFYSQRTALPHHRDTLFHSSRLFFLGIYSVPHLPPNPDNDDTVVP